MNVHYGLRLFIFLPAILMANAHAEEANFGKTTPNKDKIIEFFKSGASNRSDETSNIGTSTSEGEPSGVKTRGLKFIDASKSASKHQPAKHALHKAATHALKEKAISLEVLFDYNSANLTPAAKEQLRPVGSALSSNELTGFRYRIEGHTDIIGGDQFNIDLSRRRAQAVKEFLTQQAGLKPSSTHIVGKGKQDLADKKNPASEVNRRVRIVRLGE